MSKITGFLDYDKKDFSLRKVKDRILDFNEFKILQAEEELKKQAGRCMDCGIPYCHALGCPLYNLIPEWNDLVRRGKWHEAYLRLEMTNPFPEFTGRICPAPCEPACSLSVNMGSVTIKQLELAIIEYAFKKGWVLPFLPKKETNKRIAIVGSGPAGLSAASILRRAGHTVVVFESSDKAGGILRYGVPNYNLEKKIIDRRIKLMEAEGIRFETDVIVGEDLSARYLKRTFDCILLALGAGVPRDLHIPGRELTGIHFAMDYLSGVNDYLSGKCSANEIISAKEKDVLIIGGGDTGADCIGMANRQRAKNIYQIEIQPKLKKWDNPWNPEWPYVPSILKTYPSHEEGCIREWGVKIKSFLEEKGSVSGVECIKTDSHEKSGDTGTQNTLFKIKTDLVLLAIGYLHSEHNRLLKELGIIYDKKGNIQINNEYSTNIHGVFASGDCCSGSSLIVHSIFNGFKVAEYIHDFLV